MYGCLSIMSISFSSCFSASSIWDFLVTLGRVSITNGRHWNSFSNSSHFFFIPCNMKQIYFICPKHHPKRHPPEGERLFQALWCNDTRAEPSTPSRVLQPSSNSSSRSLVFFHNSGTELISRLLSTLNEFFTCNALLCGCEQAADRWFRDYARRQILCLHIVYWAV